MFSWSWKPQAGMYGVYLSMVWILRRCSWSCVCVCVGVWAGGWVVVCVAFWCSLMLSLTFRCILAVIWHALPAFCIAPTVQEHLFNVQCGSLSSIFQSTFVKHFPKHFCEHLPMLAASLGKVVCPFRPTEDGNRFMILRDTTTAVIPSVSIGIICFDNKQLGIGCWEKYKLVWDTFAGTCFKCKQLGHISSECPTIIHKPPVIAVKPPNRILFLPLPLLPLVNPLLVVCLPTIHQASSGKAPAKIPILIMINSAEKGYMPSSWKGGPVEKRAMRFT